MKNVILMTTMLLSIAAISSPLCLYQYSSQKQELYFIYSALDKHVEKKQITLELTKESILQFLEIIDPNHFLLTKSLVDQLQNPTNDLLKLLRSEVTSQNTRNFHAQLQSIARQSRNALYTRIEKDKNYRDEIEKRIESYEKNPEHINTNTTHPENEAEAINKILDHLTYLSLIEKSNSSKPLSTREALVLGLRNFKDAIADNNYLYSSQALPYLIAKSFIDSMDAHSSLLIGEDYLSLISLFSPDRAGIGINYTSHIKGLEIKSLFPGYGAEKAGLKKDDIITHIKMLPEEQEVFTKPLGYQSEWTLTRSLNKNTLRNKILFGPENSYIEIRVLRKGISFETKIKRLTIRKSTYKLHSHIFSTENKKISYIKLDQFYKEAPEDIAGIIQSAKKQNASGLILDLRKNLGGSTQSFIEILGLFIKKGPAMVVNSHNSDTVMDIIPNNDSPQALWDRPLFVLVDQYTASSSEALSGALKDYGRAIIIGANSSTAGKGSVQEINTINFFSGYKVTQSLFSSPAGGHRQFDGVTPDIIIPGYKTDESFFEKNRRNALKPLKISNVLDNEQKPFIENKDELVKNLKSQIESFDNKDNQAKPQTRDDLLNKSLYLMNLWLSEKN